MAAVGSTVPVPVKSAWSSKINISQLAFFLSTGAVGLVGVLGLDAGETAKVTASVAMAGQVLTFVLKTWFTNSVVASSTKS